MLIMPRKALKQRKRGFDPHAFEFTGEEAIQADNAAKARPTFRRQKLSILSALPAASSPFTTPAERPILTFRGANDHEETRGVDNDQASRSTSRQFRHSLGVSRRDTKQTKGGRDKPSSRSKQKTVKRKSTREPVVSPSVRREVTPDPPLASIQNTTEESGEVSSVLRRSGRKRYRTAKALQVVEESRKKLHTLKRRRSIQGAESNVHEEGNGTSPTRVPGSRESFKEQNDLSKSDGNHCPVDEDELHPVRSEQVEVPSQLEKLSELKDNESSETAKDTLPGRKLDTNASNTLSETLKAKNTSDALDDVENESRLPHSPPGQLHAPTADKGIDEIQTQDLEHQSFSSNPLVLERRAGQSKEQGQEHAQVESESSIPEGHISDQKKNEDAGNNTRSDVQEEKLHDCQRQGEDITLSKESEPSPLKREPAPAQKDQNSGLFVSPVTPTQPTKVSLGYASDLKVVGNAMRDATEEKILPQRVEIKGSSASSDLQTTVTTVVQSTESSSQTIAGRSHGLSSPTKQKSEAHLRASPNTGSCEEVEETSSRLMGKASLRSVNMSSIVVSQTENATRPVVTASSEATLGKSVTTAGVPEFQNNEASGKNGNDPVSGRNSTTRNVLKCTESDSSAEAAKRTMASRPGAEVPRELLREEGESVLNNEEGIGSLRTKNGVPFMLMENESKAQGEDSVEGVESEKGLPEITTEVSQKDNEDTHVAQKTNAKSSSSQLKQIDISEQHKSVLTTSLGKRINKDNCEAQFTTTNLTEHGTAPNSHMTQHDSTKSKQTFSKRVRFAEPEGSSLPSVGRKGFGDIMKMRLRKARRKQMTPLVPHGVTVMTIRGSGPNEKERRVFLDELQYILDGIFKPSGKAEKKSPQLESQLISKTLISLTQLLTRKSREVKSSEEDESDSALIQILSTQPSLFRSIVSQLCGVFGKSRSIDVMLAVVFVLIFRGTPKLLLINAAELDILLNAFFRSSAAALKEDELESSRRSSAMKSNKRIDTKKRRGRLATHLEESKTDSSVLSALNKVVAETSIAEEEFSGFRNEAVAASHLIGTALSLVMCFHGNLRSLMQENRRLDKVIAVLYSCEKLMVQKTDSGSEEKKLQFVHDDASTSWVVLGASLKILEFAILDKVCQARTSRESRLCAIVVNVIRSVDCLREGMFGSEWILSAALRVAINLCHGFGDASRQFVKQKGHELALMWVAKESHVAGLLPGREEHLCIDNVDESFDVRVLCLALLATIVHQERDICEQFRAINVDGFRKRNAGGLEIAIEILHAAEMVLEVEDAEAKTHDVEEEGRRRPLPTLAHTQHSERAEMLLEKKITIGYASLLIGALVQENVKNRKIAEQLIPSNNLVGVAAVLTQFLEFHHEVGIISGSMDRMYARIIDGLVRPFQGKDATAVEDGRSWTVDREDNCQLQDVSIPSKAECT